MRADLWAYLRAVWHSWVSLMSGSLALVAWAVAAAAEPWPMSARLAFVAFGAAAAILAGFAVWRNEYRARLAAQAESLTAAGRRRLLRVAEEGERRIAADQAAHAGAGQTLTVLKAAGSLQEWYRETLAELERDFRHLWDHFADLRPFGADGVDAARAQAERLVRRIREAADDGRQPPPGH